MNISTALLNEGIIYDRYLGEELSLPYSFENIKIQSNETVSSSLINLKFKHLYDNFLYLYKNTLLASNVIPISSTAIAGVSSNSTKFTWYRGLSSRQFIPLSTNTSLVGIDKTDVINLIKNNDIDRYSLFTSSGPSIIVFNFDYSASYISKVYTQSQIDENYGVPFSNISDFEIYDNNLFVLDSGINRLVKYDASGFTQLNVVTNNRLLYVNSIGNYGDFNSKTDFNYPKAITIYNGDIFVLDSGNSAVKKYDTNLNWISTYRLYKDFLSAFPVDIGNDSTGSIYILTNNNKLYIYDNKLENKTEYNLSALLGVNETVNKIVFSKTNNNVFYIATNKNIFKKLVNKPYDTIGKYLLYLSKYDIPDEQIIGFTSAPSLNLENDVNIMFSVSGNTGKFGNFFDNLNLFDILAVRDFDIYDYDTINFDSNEYVQSWVLNKNISKLLINHMRLRDQIIGKFIATKDYKNNIFFRGTRYLLPDELDSIYFEQDITNFVGGNELLTNSIINRPLRKIYDIQYNILNILKAEIIKAPGTEDSIKLN